MEQKYLENLDCYEVDKAYYLSYAYRYKDRNLMKLTPRENLTIWQDLETRAILSGVEEKDVMGTKARRFFIFELLDEELLGPEKTTQYIDVDAQTYIKFLETVSKKKEKNND